MHSTSNSSLGNSIAEQHTRQALDPNIVMAYIVMAYIVMAYIVMAYIVMAYTYSWPT